jgi:hypothetical protein
VDKTLTCDCGFVAQARDDSAAFTLDTYGHLLGDDLGPHLEVGFEMRMTSRRPRASPGVLLVPRRV